MYGASVASEAGREFVERDPDSIMDGDVGGEFVVAAAKVLHERVPGRDGAQRADRLQAAHRPKPRLESSMVGLHPVVAVLLQDVTSTRNEFVEHPRIHRRPVGRHLDRRRAVRQRAGEERPRRRAVATLRDQDVDDLAVLIDGAVEVGPPAGDLDVGLIDEPPLPVACRAGRAASMNSGVNVCTHR